MSKHVKPWTFEPFEVDKTEAWTVYDGNLARIVAVFYDEDEAQAYLRWRNKKQAKKKAKKQAAASADLVWGSRP